MKKINLHYCQVRGKDHPMAIARFTAYDEADRVSTVEQVTYPYNKEYFEHEVLGALRAGVDVSVFTTEPISAFPVLEKIANHKEHY